MLELIQADREAAIARQFFGSLNDPVSDSTENK